MKSDQCTATASRQRSTNRGQVPPNVASVNETSEQSTSADLQEVELPQYQPAEFYWRRAFRGSDDPHRLRAIGLEAVREMEGLRSFIRELGYEPPRFRILREEPTAGRATV